MAEMLFKSILVDTHQLTILYQSYLLDRAVAEISGYVEPPAKIALLSDQYTPSDVLLTLERQVSDLDFELVSIKCELACRPALGDVTEIIDQLAKNKLSSDDILFCVGSSSLISIANLVSTLYKRGIYLALLPCDVLGLSTLFNPLTRLDTDTITSCVQARVHADLFLVDPALMSRSAEYMDRFKADLLQAAVQKSSDAIHILKNLDTIFQEQLIDCMFHHIPELAGDEMPLAWFFAQALQTLKPSLELDQCIVEALVFSSRLAVASDVSDREFVRDLDMLIKHLGLKGVEDEIDPFELKDAIKKIVFSEQRTLTFNLPATYGYMQEVALSEELLEAHCKAWAAAHNKQYGA